MKAKQPNNGFLYVASLSPLYYKAALRSAVSLKDCYPEAKITLFTHKQFINDADRQHFDQIITDIPIHKRAKMWAMARSPYDTTFYLDADTEIQSEDIAGVFDHIKGHDLRFTGIVHHVSKDVKVEKGTILQYHGGVCLYKSRRPIIKQLMQDWFDTYVYQCTCNWEKSKFKQYDKGMKPWDQFSLWWLLNTVPKYSKLKHSLFPDGGFEYNYIYLLSEQRKENQPYQNKQPIVYHLPIPGFKQDAKYIKAPPGSSEDFD